MTFIDIIILAVVAVALFFAIKSFFKKGRSGCSSCPHNRQCGKKCCGQENKNEEKIKKDLD